MTNEKIAESPLEKKIRLGLIIGSATLVGACFGFLYGAHYGRWSSQPIRIIEQNIDDDQIPDLSIADRELNRRRYVGTPGGEYRFLPENSK